MTASGATKADAARQLVGVLIVPLSNLANSQVYPRGRREACRLLLEMNLFWSGAAGLPVRLPHGAGEEAELGPRLEVLAQEAPIQAELE